MSSNLPPRHAGSGTYIVAVVAVAVITISLLVPPGRLPALPLCTFKSWTGLPCLTCGMTHAFCSIGHGAWRQAWSYHPFAFVLYAAVLFLAILPLIRRRYPEFKPWQVARPIVWGGLLLGAALFIFWIYRLSAGGGP